MTDYDISCRRLTDLTTAYLEAAMDSTTKTVFEQHLVVCDYCVAHLDQIRITRDVLRSLARHSESPTALLRALAADDV